jgi:nondiscriminating aspartyl-tRNA synthetase
LDMAVFRSFSTITPADHEKEVSLAGWVEDVRNLGGIAFLILRQRSGTFQSTIKKKAHEDLFNRASKVVRESVVAVRGTVQPNPQARNGWELLATSFDVLSPAAAPLPLPIADKVGAEVDTRFDNRVLDLRKPERRAIFRVRSLVAAAFRSSLDRQGFVEVHTPKLAGAGAEGGATLFETNYFGRRAFLSQSPQLYKQMLMSTGLDRVYELAPAFRAEPSDTIRHVTEFTSFDGEVAWIERMEDFFPFLEGAVDAAFERVRTEAKSELELLQVEPKRPTLPLKRISYTEGLEILRGHGRRLRDGDDLDTESEKVLGQAMAKEGHDLYFVTEYPSGIKPFYVMPKSDEPAYSHSFDLEYKGDEMASGGQREHRYDHLVAKIKEKGLNPESFEFYLKAFRYGMPPHGGWGFGLDRFVQKLLGLPNIREAILFPHDRVRLVP